MPHHIFVSYRREDAGGDAGRLADHLHRRFGRKRVFLDIDTIDPGSDFARVLHDSLQQTVAVLIVIGPRWTSMRNPDGTPRFVNANDWVRLEVEAALGRNIPVIPVLVQGATMPREEDLPPSMAALVTRQAVTLDHAEFHDDAERLCDRLSAIIGIEEPTRWSVLRRWWPAAGVVLIALGLTAYLATRVMNQRPGNTVLEDPAALERTRNAEALVETAAAQRRRNQFADALATLAKARELAPSLALVRDAQDEAAMEWIRNVRIEGDTGKFGEVIAPALSVIDASLPSATGVRRADLLSHTGWATFLLWRDGDRRLDPAASYREALSIDPGNPFANAMLAHWTLFQDRDAVAAAVTLFDTAASAGRALDTVRTLQWAAFNNSNSPAAEAERVRLANVMRKAGERIDIRQAQSMWAPYYFAMASDREAYRDTLLEALSPDEYISTLNWAFEDYAAKDEGRLMTIRYYVALLHVKAGRVDQAAVELRALDKQLSGSPGVLQDAVQATLERLAPTRQPRRRR